MESLARVVLRPQDPQLEEVVLRQGQPVEGLPQLPAPAVGAGQLWHGSPIVEKELLTQTAMRGHGLASSLTG